MRKQLILVVAIIMTLAVAFIYAFIHPSGLTVQGSWSDTTILGSGTIHYEAKIVNHENEVARSVQLVLWLFDSRNFMVKTENIDLGDIPSMSSKEVNLDIQHSSFTGISRIEERLTWNP